MQAATSALVSQHFSTLFTRHLVSHQSLRKTLKGPLGRDGRSLSLPQGGRMRFSCSLHTRDSCASIPGHAGSLRSSATQAPLVSSFIFLSASQWGRPLFSSPFLLLLRFFCPFGDNVTISGFCPFFETQCCERLHYTIEYTSAVNGRTIPSLHTTKCRRNNYYLLLLESPRRG